jgi:acetyltransferase-like isoleucine patch superfamily enzyme
MMSYIEFVKVLVSSCLNYFVRMRKYSTLKRANSTCRIDITSTINDCRLGRYVVIFDSVNLSRTYIDDYTYIQSSSRIFNCTIGKFCSIAAGVTIAPGMHDLRCVTTHPALLQKSTPLPVVFSNRDNQITHKCVTIGNDVWIGENAVILDGVSIGNGAVIAAGAVVIRDVVPFEVVGGVPAKHLKFRFDADTICSIQQSQWWSMSEEWLHKNSSKMLNVDDFIELCQLKDL